MYEVRMRKARARQILRPLYWWVREARRSGITLARSDFRFGEGQLTLDGMPAGEWLDAMTMD
jgi:hypothetical protein